MARDQNNKQIENFLWILGQERLKPTDEYIDDAKKLGQAVLQMLQKKSEFSIPKVHFAGSMGKNTAILYPDLDLVAVVNEVLPPFKGVLDDFEEVIASNFQSLKIRQGSIRRTVHSIQFEFNNGIEVDLLPAANLKPEQISKLIQQNPKSYSNYSCSLVGRQLEFMRSHPSNFVHVVIRIAKLWFKSLICFKRAGRQGWRKYERLSGGSLIMELIGTAAAEKEESWAKGHNEKASVLSAFADVIDMACKMRRLKLAFRKVSKGTWERIPRDELGSKSSSNFVPSHILTRRCFIVEPANPHNDLLWEKYGVLDMFMWFGRQTRRRLANLMAENNGNSIDLTDNFLKLFYPQPGELFDQFGIEEYMPSNVQVIYSSPSLSSACFSVKVRRGQPLCKEENWLIDIMKRNLCTVISLTVAGIGISRQGDIMTVKDAVESLVDENLAMSLRHSPYVREVEMDVTISIPFQIQGRLYLARFSMQWD